MLHETSDLWAPESVNTCHHLLRRAGHESCPRTVCEHVCKETVVILVAPYCQRERIKTHTTPWWCFAAGAVLIAVGAKFYRGSGVELESNDSARVICSLVAGETV